MTITEFREAVYRHYESSGRIFPWRETVTPWGVLVSEFMLQQTQTARVVRYWTPWMEKYPSPESLAEAPLAAVLRDWSGLGYNRRGKYLRDAAGEIAEKHGGAVPETPAKLKTLPGTGDYTAGAVACFAYNYPSVFAETNIRAAVIHCFFPEKPGSSGEGRKVGDRDIFPLLEEALDRENPRKWYWALMDYGAALKKLTANPSRRHDGYAKQGAFAGSFRQKRARALKSLAFDGAATAETLATRTGLSREELSAVMEDLERDRLAVASPAGEYRIP